jgi:serine/threonine protein kinase
LDRLTFLSRLRQSRLLSTEQLADIAARYGAGVPGHAVAAALINDGTLTRFQAQRLWAGQVKGLVLGQYRILDELGEGGFGRVYKAAHTLMGRVVALKVISPKLVQDRRARDWFKREVRAVTQLSHPNVVMAYDADEVEDVLFLAMEYVDGPSLDGLVRRRGPLAAGLACDMMRQAARALQYAHEKGVIHRDIKPANLLVGRPADGLGGRPVVKVVDFGLARLHGAGAGSQTLTLQGARGFVGTPDFVSPEQARDVHAVDVRSDLYSLGCTFYFALSGSRPFAGNSVVETVVKHMQEEARPLDAGRPEVPAALAAVVSRLMAKDPAERFQTPGELIEHLAPLCEKHVPPEAAFAGRPAAGRPPGVREEPEDMPATALVSDLAFWSGPDSDGPAADDLPATPPALGAAAVTPQAGSTSGAIAVKAAPAVAAAIQVCDVRSGAARPEVRPAPAEEQTAAQAPVGETSLQFGPALVQPWREWVAVVEMVAGGGKAQDVAASAYRELHGRLLAACRAALATAAGPRRAVLQRLETVVEPWLAPHALATMDREALLSLCQRCRQVDHDLGGRRAGSTLWRWAVLFVALFFGLSLAGWLCRQQTWMMHARSWAAALWLLVQHHPVLATAALLPVAVGTALLLLPRLLRA